jgi:signal transduction histidine kinase
MLRGHQAQETIVLEIQDNGAGFNSHLLYSGYGLQGIQERVIILGGQFHVESKFNQGTTVKVTIPIPSCL